MCQHTPVPARSFALVLELNQNIVQASIGQGIGDLRSVEGRLAELDRRLHSSLGYKSPADFEEDRIVEASVA